MKYIAFSALSLLLSACATGGGCCRDMGAAGAPHCEMHAAGQDCCEKMAGEMQCHDMGAAD